VTASPIVKEHCMSLHCREPRLEEMLADSITRAVMEADGVDPGELEVELRQTAALLDATQRTLIPPSSARSDLRGKRGIT
jgi:alkylhydroperoxidase family enzyme